MEFWRKVAVLCIITLVACIFFMWYLVTNSDVALGLWLGTIGLMCSLIDSV